MGAQIYSLLYRSTDIGISALCDVVKTILTAFAGCIYFKLINILSCLETEMFENIKAGLLT